MKCEVWSAKFMCDSNCYFLLLFPIVIVGSECSVVEVGLLLVERFVFCMFKCCMFCGNHVLQKRSSKCVRSRDGKVYVSVCLIN
jgi:hypothetical protein